VAATPSSELNSTHRGVFPHSVIALATITAFHINLTVLGRSMRSNVANDEVVCKELEICATVEDRDVLEW
jgi:hypothetical protein